MLLKNMISKMGGKAFITSWLCQHIPTHRLYCEPFCGGAKLFYAKELSVISVLNDADDMLVNLYRCIQNSEKRQKLVNLLNETPYARSVFQAWKYGEETPLGDIEKAARYFYLCKASFAGDVRRGGFGIPSKWTGRNPAQSYSNSIASLEGVAERLRGVTIECLDYADCIRRYDSSDTLYYIDPPYLDADKYYGDSFSLEDHYRLSEILRGAKGKAMITHYKNGLYNELYQGWHRYEYSSFKGSHKSEGESKPKTVECLWTNFEPPLRNKSLFQGVNFEILSVSGGCFPCLGAGIRAASGRCAGCVDGISMRRDT